MLSHLRDLITVFLGHTNSTTRKSEWHCHRVMRMVVLNTRTMTAARNLRSQLQLYNLNCNRKLRITPQRFVCGEWDLHHSKDRVALSPRHSDSSPKYSDLGCRSRKKRENLNFTIAVSMNCNRFSKSRCFWGIYLAPIKSLDFKLSQ